MQKDLPVTGERMIPTMKNALIVIEHLHRYALAQRFCDGKTVLDIACGEGYGSDLLAQQAEKVIGVDIDPFVVKHAADTYKRENLSFLVGSTDAIPVASNSMDVVVSFETLEHHDKHEEMMQEIKRVLKADGMLIISTPDRKYYSDVTRFKNPYHVKELYSDEFRKILNKYFPFVKLIGQTSGTVSVLYPFENGNFTTAWRTSGEGENLKSAEALNAEYLIAIASHSEIHYAPLSIFDGTSLDNSIRDEYANSIRRSRPYQIGTFVLSPFRWFRTRFSRKN
jgi:ubiquinone/menaquinone biosynthesis C-methylase UbiE